MLDLWPDTLKAVGVVNSPRLLGVVGWLVRQVYRHCDLVLGQSRSFIDNIRHYATERTAVEYFPGWAEAGLQQEDVTPAPELPRRPEVFTIVFAGNIGDAQDFPAILDAAERLRSRQDIRWAIVGDGRMAPWVREQIDARQLDLSVVMLGRHPLERMPAFFAHADALLVSLKDRPVFAMTIPGKLQAYLATGLPVLAMLNGEGARIVQDGNAGLVCAAGDAQGLADNVVRLAQMSAQERAAFGTNARRLCATEFDRAALISRLEGWFFELTAGSQERADAQRERG